MNPASYENLDNVDWAALAQQWIHMQDVALPAAPPPPIFTTPGIVTRPIYEEKGEADMEVDEPIPFDPALAWTNSVPPFPPPLNHAQPPQPVQWPSQDGHLAISLLQNRKCSHPSGATWSRKS